MAKFIAVTQVYDNPDVIRVHMVQNFGGNRNEVVQYYNEYNRGLLVSIDAIISIMTCMNVGEAYEVVHREGNMVEMMTLRGNNWRSVIYCEKPPEDSSSLIDCVHYV